ncbi:MAG: aldose 1-epimerase family protein [Steroidobacteraceae bacterium]|jgi:galactose mutarotase-like enzyme
MSIQHSQWLSLRSNELSAEVDPLGAQLSTLRDQSGRDLLWTGDASVWAGRAPLLFPIVGALAGGTYRLGSKIYHLSRHGFARGSRFEIVDSGAASAVFRLKADAASLQRYPFNFELDVRFALDGATLSITTAVRNHGEESMPASFGYHPGFQWPLPFGQARSSHFIEFAADEPSPARRLDAAGLLTPERHVTPIIQRRLALTDSLFEDDVIIFDDVQSRFVIYGANDGPRIRVGFPDAPFLGVWTKPRANFVCIEPWHGVADPQGYSGDFREKPGVFMVPAGAGFAMTMTISLLLR